MNLHDIYIIIYDMNNIFKDNLTSAHDTPAERIFRFIRKANLQPGDKLPVREKLANTLNLGPRVLREALSILEHCGIIRTQSKAGTIITNPNPEKLENPLRWHLELTGYKLDDIIRTRASIEAICAYEAAQYRTHRDLLAILIALEELEEKAKAKQNDLEEELKFHLAILNATHNPVMAIFNKLIIANIRKTCGNSAFETTNAKKANLEHRQIYEAIKNKHSIKAMKIMHAHILSSMSKKSLKCDYYKGNKT